MQINKKVVILVEALALAFVIWACIGIFTHSKSLKEISITLTPGGQEYRDKVVLGIGKKDEAPDYRLRLRTNTSWVELGTYANTWMGDGLIFKPQSNIPLTDIVSIQLMDDDKFENDVLEEFPYEKSTHIGKNYSFNIASKNSLESGFGWFFKTPVGIAILTGITIAIIVVVLYHMS